MATSCLLKDAVAIVLYLLVNSVLVSGNFDSDGPSNYVLDTSRLLNKRLNKNPLSGQDTNPYTKYLTSDSGQSQTKFLAHVTSLAREVLADDFAALSNSSYDVSRTCLNHTELLLAGILNTEQWALRMLDAVGKPPSGLLDMNLQWLGSYDECLAVQAVVYGDPVNKTDPQSHPYTGRYCKASFLLTLSSLPASIARKGLPLSVGLCVPSTCSSDDVTALVKTGIFALLVNTSTLPEPTVECQLQSLPLDTKAVVAIVVCSLLATALVLGTVYDVIAIQWHLTARHTPVEARTSQYKKFTQPEHGHEASATIYRNGGNADVTVAVPASDGSQLDLSPKDDRIEDGHLVLNTEQGIGNKVTGLQCPSGYQPGTLGKVLLAFSVYTNASKILNTRQPAGTLSAVNGIRFLSLTWVLLGHTFQSLPRFADNMVPYTLKLQKRWTFQAIVNGTFSVDSFFLLSGLLVAYLTLKELKKLGGIKRFRWGMFYFHRFWRLTPPYMLTLMVYLCLMRYFSSGPLWAQEGVEANDCSDTWWRNLLYVNNLYGKSCMGWSWYLANDMQFFVVSPLLLIPLYYSSMAGGFVALVFLLACFVSAGAISAAHGYPANGRFATGPGFNVDLYSKPYTRIGPYIVGIVSGYVLYRTDCKLRIPRALNLVGWAAAAGTALAALYGLYNPDDNLSSHLDTGVAALYNALSRTAWGVAVAWVVVACATGNGGFVNTLLSWSVFVPLGRLTYCAYLFHAVVVYTYFMSRGSLIHCSDLTVVYYFLGNVCMSYGAAFLVSLAFEAPMMGLEKALLGRGKHS